MNPHETGRMARGLILLILGAGLLSVFGPARAADEPVDLAALMKQAGLGQFTAITWQLGARGPETNAPTADELEMKQRFGPDAPLLSSPRGEPNHRQFHFEDLPGDLQRVLRVQLRHPGDISAEIETPTGVLLYVCQVKTTTTLGVASLSLPKRSFAQWFAERSSSLNEP